MAALSWLLIPAIAALAAGLWGRWAAKRTTSTPDAVGVEGYARFRAAMERTRGEAETEDAENAAEADTAHDESGAPQSGASGSPVPAVAGPAGVPDGPARTAD